MAAIMPIPQQSDWAYGTGFGSTHTSVLGSTHTSVLGSAHTSVLSGSLRSGGVLTPPRSEHRSLSPAPVATDALGPLVCRRPAGAPSPVASVAEVVQRVPPQQREPQLSAFHREGRAVVFSQRLPQQEPAARTLSPPASSLLRAVPPREIRPAVLHQTYHTPASPQTLEVVEAMKQAGLQRLGRLEDGLACIRTQIAHLVAGGNLSASSADGDEVERAQLEKELRELRPKCDAVALAEDLRAKAGRSLELTSLHTELRERCAEGEILARADRRRQERLERLEAELLRLAPLETRLPRAAEELAEAEAKNHIANEELALARRLQEEREGRPELNRMFGDLAHVDGQLTWYRAELDRVHGELEVAREATEEVRALQNSEAVAAADLSAERMRADRLEGEVARLRPMEAQLEQTSEELARALQSGQRQHFEIQQVRDELSIAEAQWAQLREELAKANLELDRRKAERARGHAESSVLETDERGASLGDSTCADELARAREELARAEAERACLQEARAKQAGVTDSQQSTAATTTPFEADTSSPGDFIEADDDAVPKSGNGSQWNLFQQSTGMSCSVHRLVSQERAASEEGVSGRAFAFASDCGEMGGDSWQPLAGEEEAPVLDSWKTHNGGQHKSSCQPWAPAPGCRDGASQEASWAPWTNSDLDGALATQAWEAAATDHRLPHIRYQELLAPPPSSSLGGSGGSDSVTPSQSASQAHSPRLAGVASAQDLAMEPPQCGASWPRGGDVLPPLAPNGRMPVEWPSCDHGCSSWEGMAASGDDASLAKAWGHTAMAGLSAQFETAFPLDRNQSVAWEDTAPAGTGAGPECWGPAFDTATFADFAEAKPPESHSMAAFAESWNPAPAAPSKFSTAAMPDHGLNGALEEGPLLVGTFSSAGTAGPAATSTPLPEFISACARLHPAGVDMTLPGGSSASVGACDLAASANPPSEFAGSMPPDRSRVTSGDNGAASASESWGAPANSGKSAEFATARPHSHNRSTNFEDAARLFVTPALAETEDPAVVADALSKFATVSLPKSRHGRGDLPPSGDSDILAKSCWPRVATTPSAEAATTTLPIRERRGVDKPRAPSGVIEEACDSTAAIGSPLDFVTSSTPGSGHNAARCLAVSSDASASADSTWAFLRSRAGLAPSNASSRRDPAVLSDHKRQASISLPEEAIMPRSSHSSWGVSALMEEASCSGAHGFSDSAPMLTAATEVGEDDDDDPFADSPTEPSAPSLPAPGRKGLSARNPFASPSSKGPFATSGPSDCSTLSSRNPFA